MGLYQRDETLVWWMSYSVNGKQVRETTGTSNKKEAERILAAAITTGKVPN
jgi:hypothetical protein